LFRFPWKAASPILENNKKTNQNRAKIEKYPSEYLINGIQRFIGATIAID